MLLTPCVTKTLSTVATIEINDNSVCKKRHKNRHDYSVERFKKYIFVGWNNFEHVKYHDPDILVIIMDTHIIELLRINE